MLTRSAYFGFVVFKVSEMEFWEHCASLFWKTNKALDATHGIGLEEKAIFYFS